MMLVSMVWQTPLALTGEVPGLTNGSTLSNLTAAALQVAVSIRIGNLCGAGVSEEAKASARAAQLASLAVVSFLTFLVLIFGQSFAQQFTRDPAVLALSESCVCTLSLSRPSLLIL